MVTSPARIRDPESRSDGDLILQPRSPTGNHPGHAEGSLPHPRHHVSPRPVPDTDTDADTLRCHPNSRQSGKTVVMACRRAGARDQEAVTDTLAGAFRSDPAWSWVFSDASTRNDYLKEIFSILVHSAIPLGWVWLTAQAEAATVWIPPGKAELTEGDTARLDRTVCQLPNDVALRVQHLFDTFSRHRPTSPDHCYLSLFGTHPDHRGHGIGMQLLQENLEQVDALGAPAHLESTNPANLLRYRSVGFADTGTFTLSDGTPVTTMWRESPGKLPGNLSLRTG